MQPPLMMRMKNWISTLNDHLPSLREMLGKWYGSRGYWLKSLLMILLLLFPTLITVCVTYKVLVSCFLHCVSPAPTKIMISKQLETIDHIYSSL